MQMSARASWKVGCGLSCRFWSRHRLQHRSCIVQDISLFLTSLIPVESIEGYDAGRDAGKLLDISSGFEVRRLVLAVLLLVLILIDRLRVGQRR